MPQSYIFLATHPIQYLAPFFRELAQQRSVDLTVCYCSDESVAGYQDAEFGTKIQWDIPLLEGYRYRFLKNYASRPSVEGGFFSLVNWGIVGLLFRQRDATLIVHGWYKFTLLLAILAAKCSGMKVMLRCENPYHQEIQKSRHSLWLKRFLFGKCLFPLVDAFLYVGEENRKFYRYYGVADKKLIFAPYCVENTRWQQAYTAGIADKHATRAMLGIPPHTPVVLTAGKYISKKNPMDLLRAFHRCALTDKFLILMGEGELRADMEAYIRQHRVKNVLLTGFQNQTEMYKFYAVADLFVLPSGMGETWGLVVNEAMNYRLPLLVADMVGCAADLVDEGRNGHTFRTGDVDELAAWLDTLLASPATLRCMGEASFEKVQSYSYDTCINNLTANSHSV